MTMKIFFVSCAFILLMASAVFSFEGPLQTRDQFPLFLNSDTPYLESATTGSSFSAGLSQSSVFMTRASQDWSVNLDLEVTSLDLRYRRDIPGLFEFGIDVPVLSYNSGFLDGFLNGYHRAFGFPDYGRSSRPDNSFLYEVRKNGILVASGKNGSTGIGDIRLAIKKELLTNDPVISIRAEVELPTGDASRGFGSGSFDGGASVLVDKKLGEKFMSYFNLGFVLPGNIRADETIKSRNFIHGGAGIEAALWSKVSLLGQVYFQTSPWPKTDIGSIDRISGLLSLGGRYTSGKDSIEMSLSEDINTAGAPDITLSLFYKRRF